MLRNRTLADLQLQLALDVSTRATALVVPSRDKGNEALDLSVRQAFLAAAVLVLCLHRTG